MASYGGANGRLKMGAEIHQGLPACVSSSLGRLASQIAHCFLIVRCLTEDNQRLFRITAISICKVSRSTYKRDWHV